jgi:hypothetical protein
VECTGKCSFLAAAQARLALLYGAEKVNHFRLNDAQAQQLRRHLPRECWTSRTTFKWKKSGAKELAVLLARAGYAKGWFDILDTQGTWCTVQYALPTEGETISLEYLKKSAEVIEKNKAVASNFIYWEEDEVAAQEALRQITEALAALDFFEEQIPVWELYGAYPESPPMYEAQCASRKPRLGLGWHAAQDFH